MVNDRQSLDLTPLSQAAGGAAVEWLISGAPVPYPEALAVMEARAAGVVVWVKRPDKGEGREDKIAAIGVRLKRWVSMHGISINVEPDLAHFEAILPCGVVDPRYGVTSLADLGHLASMAEGDIALRQAFEVVFGRVHPRLPEATI